MELKPGLHDDRDQTAWDPTSLIRPDFSCLIGSHSVLLLLLFDWFGIYFNICVQLFEI